MLLEIVLKRMMLIENCIADCLNCRMEREKFTHHILPLASKSVDCMKK